MRPGHFAKASAWAVLGACSALFAATPACSLGEGEGEVYSDLLYAVSCWNDRYDMGPDFFAAEPFRDTMQIRVQRGSDLKEVSDGLVILVNDVSQIRGKFRGQAIPVSLPPGVAPPGVPVGQQCGGEACPDPTVHVALYLHASCHNQNTVLYGLSGTVMFNELFSGDENEDTGSDKLTDATFDVMVGDPRDAPLTGEDAGVVPNQTHLQGNFHFFFERGQPAQPFP